MKTRKREEEEDTFTNDTVSLAWNALHRRLERKVFVKEDEKGKFENN